MDENELETIDEERTCLYCEQKMVKLIKQIVENKEIKTYPFSEIWVCVNPKCWAGMDIEKIKTWKKVG